MSYRCGSRTDSGSKCKRKVTYEGEKCHNHDADKKYEIDIERRRTERMAENKNRDAEIRRTNALIEQMIEEAKKRMKRFHKKKDYKKRDMYESLTSKGDYQNDESLYDYDFIKNRFWYLLDPDYDNEYSPPAKEVYNRLNLGVYNNTPALSEETNRAILEALFQEIDKNKRASDFFDSPPKSPKKSKSPPKSPKKAKSPQGFATMGIANPEDFESFGSPPKSPKKSRSPPKSPKKIRRKSSDLVLYGSPPRSSPKLRRLKKRA
jgi:hypothetical protein